MTVVRFWNQEDWTLSERKEIIFRMSETLHDMGERILKEFSGYIDSHEHLSICKLNSTWSFMRKDLFNENVSKL